LIFHSTFIGRAGPKNKGRISRYLANKCSLASRIDSFSDNPNPIYGTKLRSQVEERLEFYRTGQAPRKNIDVMHEALQEAEAVEQNEDEHQQIADQDVEMIDESKLSREEKNPKKKEKKEKKDKKEKKKNKKKEDVEVGTAEVKSSPIESPKKTPEQAPAANVADKEKSKKKKDRKRTADDDPKVEDDDGAESKKKKKKVKKSED